MLLWFSEGKGPGGTTWTFFPFLFLSLWTVTIYVKNVGPVYWGISWLPLLFSAIVLAVVLASIIPGANQLRDEFLTTTAPGDVNSSEKTRAWSGRRGISWFWSIIIILIVAIVVGMVNPQMAL